MTDVSSRCDGISTNAQTASSAKAIRKKTLRRSARAAAVVIYIGRDHWTLHRCGSAGRTESFCTASGVIVDYFENDALFDVVTSTYDASEPMHHFHKDGDRTFSEQAAKAGLTGRLGVGLNLAQADYNNDGCTDILALQAAWQSQNVARRKPLLRNNCNGTFADVTRESRLANPSSGKINHASVNCDRIRRRSNAAQTLRGAVAVKLNLVL